MHGSHQISWCLPVSVSKLMFRKHYWDTSSNVQEASWISLHRQVEPLLWNPAHYPDLKGWYSITKVSRKCVWISCCVFVRFPVHGLAILRAWSQVARQIRFPRMALASFHLVHRWLSRCPYSINSVLWQACSSFPERSILWASSDQGALQTLWIEIRTN